MTYIPRRITRVVVVAATFVLAAWAGVGPSLAAAPPAPAPNQRVVYWDTVNFEHNQVFTSGLHGGGREQLTFQGAAEDPRWGPFGHHIVYTHRTRKGGSQIWVMNARGGDKRRLSGPAGHYHDNQPAFAPGGGRVVFVRWDGHPGGDTDLVVFSFATRTITPLHVGDGFARIPETPAWSPDGTTIAFAAFDKTTGSDEPQGELFTVRPDGTGLTQITHTTQWVEEGPNWSPTSDRLVYLRSGFGASSYCQEIDTIDPDGSNRVRVPAGCYAAGASWSPGGRRLLASLGRVRHPGLWTMSPTGKHQRFVVSGEGGDWRPLRVAHP